MAKKQAIIVSHIFLSGYSFKKNELKKHLFNIKNSVFIFSFLFNGPYRESRNYFKFISKDGIYDKHKATSVLENLINFVNVEENIQIEKNRLDNEYRLVKSTIKDDFDGSNTQLKLIKELHGNNYLYTHGLKMILRHLLL